MLKQEIQKMLEAIDMSIVYQHDKVSEDEGYGLLDDNGDLLGGVLYKKDEAIAACEASPFAKTVALVTVETRSICIARIKEIISDTN